MMIDTNVDSDGNFGMHHVKFGGLLALRKLHVLRCTNG